ncbi:polycystin-2-like protein 1 [Rhopilema esculentum]|uniref:polycystin-2-like protein 1 n=1 Tax=Rhopilema esculentum TaxID=499914 RepID=UPI0031D2B0A1|eukprot:gene867-10616_t
MSETKRRKNPSGSHASLGGRSLRDEMEMHSRSRPSSGAAWSDDGPGQDDVDFNPRAPAAVDMPSAMEAEPYSMQANVTRDVRADAPNNQPVDCFTRFKRVIRGLWRTRHTEDTDTDKEMYVKTTLRELGIYLVFMCVLCILTFGMTSSTMYYFTKVMQDLFVSEPGFNDFKKMSDFWSYAEGKLLDGLFWEKYYNGQNVSKDHQGFIYFENKVLGLPRIRQVRVRNDSCVVHSDFKKEIKECYAPYATNIEDTRSFGKMNGSAWTYKSEKELEGRGTWGQLTSYSGGGFTQLLKKTKAESKALIDDLKKNLWTDRGTRAVFIDFTVYNANINLFCVVTLVLEFPATGGCIPHPMFRTLKLIRYVTPMDYFVMACEAIFVLFLVYYSIEEFIEIKKHKLAYFKAFWNVLDVVVILLGVVCIVFNLYRTLSVNRLIKSLLTNPDGFANFAVLGFWQNQYDNLVAVAVFICWIKVFKYISFNKTMTQLSSTLGKCAKDIAGFAVMFFIIFLAYAQWGYLIFGTQVKDFSTFHYSIYTLFRIILGDFNFKEIENANRILGPIFFITYVFFVFFVLINMFLAIINDTYAEVKSDLAQQKSEFEITDYFKRGYEKMMNKISFKREKIVDIQKAIQTADTNRDNKLDFEEWRQELKMRGHADAEIEAVFAKYDLDGDRVLNEEEQRKMHEDLEGQKAELNEEMEEVERAKDADMPLRATRSRVSMRDSDDDEDDDIDMEGRRGGHTGGGGVSFEEFTVLSRRVDRMEHSIGSIVSKIDAVLVKLEAMEKAKLKRRETMAKLLDSIAEDDRRDDDSRREHMEKLVREELERWDSDASLRDGGARPTSASSRGSVASAKKRPPKSPGSRISPRGSETSVRINTEDDGVPKVFNEHSKI